jgi:HAD superfamily hydrolase (TIGR01509 family)
LADSEPLCERAWTAVLADRAYRPTAADFAACQGVAFADSRDHFARRVPELLSVTELYPVYWRHLRDLYETDLRGLPDAIETLEVVRRRLPVAIASSSYRTRLDVTLRLLGVDGLPSVAGDEVARAKPAPDLFLEAARRLGVAPERVVVVEDSQAGIDAGVAAGMRVIAVDRSCGALTGAHRVVDRLHAGHILDGGGLPPA